jgi:hypothetical protein
MMRILEARIAKLEKRHRKTEEGDFRQGVSFAEVRLLKASAGLEVGFSAPSPK